MGEKLGKPALWFAVAAIGYAAGSQVAFTVLDSGGGGPTFFPSAGFSLALLCLLPRPFRRFACLGVAVAEILVDLAEGLGPVAAAGFAVANTAEPVLGALLLGAARPTGTWRGLARFVAAGVLGGPAAGAVLGATTATLAGGATDGWWAVAGRWWLGDGLGVLVIGTALLVWCSREPAGVRRAGGVLAAAAIGGLAVLVFWADLAVAGYAGVVVLGWVALWWGPRAVSAAGVVVAFVATTATAAGRGPWAGVAPASGLVHLQVLLAVVLLTMLVLAVTVTERDAAVRGATVAEERRRRAESVAEAEHAAHERARLLQAVAGGLGVATGIDRIVTVFVDVHAGALAAAAVGVRDDGGGLEARIATATGPVSRTAVPAETAEARVVRDGEPLFRTGGHPIPGGAETGAAAILPLETTGAVFGFLGLYFREPGAGPGAQRTLLLTMAAQAAQAVHRVRLYEAEQRQRRRAEDGERRQRLMSDLMSTLSTPGTTAERAQRLADALVPAFADFAVAQFGDAGDTVAVSAGDPAAAAAPGGGLPVVKTVLATGEPQGTGALIGVPLTAEGAVRGALVLGRPGSGPRFTGEDLVLAEDLAARAGLVLHAARVADRERSVAWTLQTSQLPQRPALPRGVAAAARYRPSERNLSIGGDWYDLVTLPDGHLTVTIGDVVGHGLPAAAVMGQMRSAATGLILAGLRPAAVLDRLDLVAGRTAGAEHASALVAELDPVTGRFRYAAAGHPPPVLVAPDGTVALLDGARSPLLCLPPRHGRPEAELTVLPGSALVCYTDGLIEQNRLPPHEAFAGLLAAATRYARAAPEDLCDGLVDVLVGDTPARDDIALVCLRYLPVPSARPAPAELPERGFSSGLGTAG
ncbi:SpoIIE family protein phosphatase [Amycolatopsis sp. NPDC004169]|uniref:SpoIIE family protein phosphatase n=1 Tax=Amycolatopsis sp. NPDC004169 TaxID=3154453 RepID=UPI0033A3EDF2